MEVSHSSVVYIDHRARDAREYTKANPPDSKPAAGRIPPSEMLSALSPIEEANENIHCLLSTFAKVFVQREAESCLSFLKSIHHSVGKQTSTLVLIATAPEKDYSSSNGLSPVEEEGLCGEQFLAQVTAEMKSGNIKGLLLPVALVPGRSLRRASRTWTEGKRSVGALDVLPSPLITPLPINYVDDLAKRAQYYLKQSKQQRYSNMTQDLVAKLMGDLSNFSRFETASDNRFHDITPGRCQEIVQSFNSWSFSAHDFDDTELCFGALRILQHALRQPGLEKWNMTEGEIVDFLSTTRAAYNTSVIYHNFHHACDVLQALFFFLVSIGAVPPLVPNGSTKAVTPTGLAMLIRPEDALTLLIAAIGHDVGHPGVNNLFLVKVKATVAQLYNDHSVLESYHCAASSRILSRRWPAAYSDLAMRKLMISSILATDMTLHSQYTGRLDVLRKSWVESDNTLNTDDTKTMAEHRELICCLLIKCADICNVARKYPVARRWAILVTDEFAYQGDLEQDADIPSCLFGGPPARGDITDLAKRQMGFINAFALDLFMKMTAILPGMQFTVDEINQNKDKWQQVLKDENEKQAGQPFDLPGGGRRASQVPPAQPQEIPDHDPRKLPIPPKQTQAARPSIPSELPENLSHGSRSSDRSVASHERKSSRNSIANSTADKYSEDTIAPNERKSSRSSRGAGVNDNKLEDSIAPHERKSSRSSRAPSATDRKSDDSVVPPERKSSRSSRHGSSAEKVYDDVPNPDERRSSRSSRPSSSRENGNNPSYSRYTTAPPTADGAPIFTSPFPRSLEDSSLRHRSPGGAAQSPKIAQIKSDAPRRSSHGTLSRTPTSESKDGASRRSSGMYSHSSKRSSLPNIFNSPILPTSQLRIDGSDDTVTPEGITRSHRRPFSFSYGQDVIDVRPITPLSSVRSEEPAPIETTDGSHLRGDDDLSQEDENNYGGEDISQGHQDSAIDQTLAAPFDDDKRLALHEGLESERGAENVMSIEQHRSRHIDSTVLGTSRSASVSNTPAYQYFGIDSSAIDDYDEFPISEYDTHAGMQVNDASGWSDALASERGCLHERQNSTETPSGPGCNDGNASETEASSPARAPMNSSAPRLSQDDDFDAILPVPPSQQHIYPPTPGRSSPSLLDPWHPANSPSTESASSISMQGPVAQQPHLTPVTDVPESIGGPSSRPASADSDRPPREPVTPRTRRQRVRQRFQNIIKHVREKL